MRDTVVRIRILHLHHIRLELRPLLEGYGDFQMNILAVVLGHLLPFSTLQQEMITRMFKKNEFLSSRIANGRIGIYS